MSTMKPPRVPDLPPRHPREDLHRFVNGLNVEYNLGVPILDPGLTPSERKEQETAATRLYLRLEVHFYQSGLDVVRQLTREFHLKATQSCSRWAKRPKGNPDTLPVSGSSPLATNQAERECLQSIFHEVLDRSQPKRTFSRTRSGPAAFSMEKSSTVRPKRAAETNIPDSPTKRSRLAGQAQGALQPAQNPGPAVLPMPDHLFAAPELASLGHRRHSERTERSLTESSEAFKRSTTYSTSITSKASSRSIFSKVENEPSTQETVEASSQEQRRGFMSSQDQFHPSSTMEDALNESFYDQIASDNPHSRTTGLKDEAPPQTQTTNYSYPPSSAMVEALPSSPVQQPQAQDKQVATGALVTHKSGSSFAQDLWPKLPGWLKSAPFHIAWEVLRLGLHMGVELGSVSLTYDTRWKDQKALRSALGKAFPGKSLPSAADSDAWDAATKCTPDKDQHVVFVASLEFAPVQSSSPLRLRLQPPKLDKPHRLGRKYGADRFLEMLVPSPDPSNLPSSLKEKPFYDELLDWLTREPHEFAGRIYRPFYLKPGGQRTPPKHLIFGPDPRPTYMDRIFLFAEDGVDISRDERPSTPLGSMVCWALDLKGGKNGAQPVLKLFQRLALVLSRTTPTIVFEPGQIRHRDQDLLSNDGRKVMNDGVGRMSRTVAKLIQNALGLSSPPCAVQGRLGSAKGMWIVDHTDMTDDIWIEVYPSQRKWELEAVDQEHRTLEIRSWAPEKLRSASLNLQFLPVLEDRAVDKPRMRETIGKLLEDNLRQQLSDQRQSLENPIEFQKWISSHASHRFDRLARGHVLFQGGLPREDEEIMAFMLNAGFDPWQNKFLNKKAYDAQFQMCEKLSKKLNIKIGCSAYFFMVVDFQSLLEEGEVHIAFSDRFKSDTGDWEGTMIHGRDVLVARSPAHFPSDIQRVKAVFRPELAHLQNVIVFSAKGTTPLADKLSGGDYDGDQCFCVWDDRVVENFANAPDETQHDLREFYRQDKIEFHQLLSTHNHDYEDSIGEMIEKCFAFNLSKDMLGQVTNYKERLCYFRSNVHDEVARKLSTLLSTLVDAPKQGIEFDSKDFKAFRRSLDIPNHLDDPLYKTVNQPSNQQYRHILDHLKFNIAKPAIEEELAKFHNKDRASELVYWDKDLTVEFHDEWESESRNNSLAQAILSCLKEDLGQVFEEWNALLGNDAVNFAEMVQRTYNLWREIKPRTNQPEGIPETTLQRLHRGYPQTSEWALLRASTTFKLYYQKKPLFAWQLAGWHLCFIKWQAVSKIQLETSGMPAMLTAPMYTITKVDTRAVNHLVELQTNHGIDRGDGEDEDVL